MGCQALLEALEREKYDVILMDCQMPDLDGYQATKEIRKREKASRHTWIIAMTANVMVGDREKFLAAGVDYYVSKSLRRAELSAALQRMAVGSLPPVDVATVEKGLVLVLTVASLLSPCINLRRKLSLAGCWFFVRWRLFLVAGNSSHRRGRLIPVFKRSRWLIRTKFVCNPMAKSWFRSAIFSPSDLLHRIRPSSA